MHRAHVACERRTRCQAERARARHGPLPPLGGQQATGQQMQRRSQPGSAHHVDRECVPAVVHPPGRPPCCDCPSGRDRCAGPHSMGCRVEPCSVDPFCKSCVTHAVVQVQANRNPNTYCRGRGCSKTVRDDDRATGRQSRRRSRARSRKRGNRGSEPAGSAGHARRRTRRRACATRPFVTKW